MEIFGIQFAPLNIPLQRRLETFATAAWFTVLATFGTSFSLVLVLLLILYTKWWLAAVLYLLWSYTIDRNTCERGSRRIEWVRNWTWWKYIRNYFPVQLVKVEGVELDPKRNYLFCSVPHGMLATGVFTAFGTNHSEFKELFPHHTANILTLKQHFQKPFFREIMYGLGICSSSKESMNWLLGYPEGGKVAILVVGGVAEAYYCKPGVYKSIINKRKGFVRIAIENGAAIVPTISFGETDLFDQIKNPKGSLLRKFQDMFKKITGLAPIIPLGRGFFQYTFGVIPHRAPITVVVGPPMEVQKVKNPTPEQVDAVHSQFLKLLVEVFESEKHKYLKNPKETQFEFADD